MHFNQQQLLPDKPKFLKLADLIISEIEKGRLKQHDKLPSVNELTQKLSVSKATILKGLNYLSEQGIIHAIYRKGYYVKKTDTRLGFRVMFLLDKMTTFKNEIYESFYESLSAYGEIEVYFHHHNYDMFRQLIESKLQNYTHFVVVTYLDGDVKAVLEKIPPEKLLLLDASEPKIRGNYASVYQDFENDIYRCLQEADSLLDKYEHFFLVAPPNLYHLARARKGFRRFCREKVISYGELDGIDEAHFNKKTAFLTLAAYDIDEVKIIKLTQAHQWKLGQDIGLISYNDTPVKEVLEGGITVISTDFSGMGRKAAEMIISGTQSKIANDTRLIIRNSL